MALVHVNKRLLRTLTARQKTDFVSFILSEMAATNCLEIAKARGGKSKKMTANFGGFFFRLEKST